MAKPQRTITAGRKAVIIHGKKVTDLSPRYGRPECDLWGVTRANIRFWGGKLLDWTAWVDVHPLAATGRFPGIPERRPDAWKWYLEQDGSRPIYLMAPEHHPVGADRRLAEKRFAMVPGAQPFPIREVQRRFPINGEPNRWFVEQAGMMIANACRLGYELIILNGIGCVSSLEFERAHRSILYWIGHARGMGIDVVVEGPSIFHTPAQVYSYEKFNYDAIEDLRREQKSRAERPDPTGMLEENARERRRGRPPRHRVALEEGP